MPIDIDAYNSAAWDREVAQGNPATLPVTDEEIERARSGNLSLSLTGNRPVPEEWTDVRSRRILCLALSGGQQVPLLAAAGARVTAVDNSLQQLRRDEEVCRRHGLQVECIKADMRALGRSAVAGPYDMVVVGLGLQFIEEPGVVWRQAAGMLVEAGRLLAAFVNPVQYMFEWPAYERGEFRVAHALPYSDIGSLSESERLARFDADDPIEFGHTFEQTLGDLCRAGFAIDGFIEDVAQTDPFSKYIATYYALSARLSKRPT
jgi:2-polyprenyl-3-methyl-5-hydroxy-6-metoxy-1,4-benzoquinol methylase